jgi:hypothetical protein
MTIHYLFSIQSYALKYLYVFEHSDLRKNTKITAHSETSNVLFVGKKDKAIPVTGSEGP